MYWWIILCLRNLYVAIVTSTLINLLSFMVKVELGVRGLHLPLVEHRLGGRRFVKVFHIKELYLEEVLTVVDEVSNEVYYDFL